LEIIAEILGFCREGSRKKYIFRSVGTSGSLLKEYVEILCKAGLLTRKKWVYTATAKGLEFLRMYPAYKMAGAKLTELLK